jgi:hypothetical protein
MSEHKDKNLAQHGALDIIPTRSRCGCSSVVEHLLAKEDVASSSLVTRSSLRLERSAKRRLDRSLGEGGPRGEPSYGWQASQMTWVALNEIAD